MERFFLKAFGCKVNQYDSQSLRERFLRAGLLETADPAEADLLLLNFCVVTGRAASRALRVLKSLKKNHPGAHLVAAGCLSPEDRQRVKAACPEVLFHTREEQSDLARLLGETTDQPFPPVSGHQGHTRAFLKVQDGCNLKCAYCIIPTVRGEERSRDPREVLDEAGRLLEAGFRELVLCGIRLGGYRWQDRRLHHLLAELLETYPGAFRIRISSLNPAEVTPALLDLLARDGRVAPHLHLPLQSGDPEILKRMKRPYTSEGFLAKIQRIREALPEPAFSTDLMVGFPGESETAFERSLTVLEEARVSRVHVFPYSIRAGTVAAELPQVPEPLKARRVKRALESARRLKDTFDRSFLGQKETILVEKAEAGPGGFAEGLTSRYQKTRIPLQTERTLGNRFLPVRLLDYTEGLFTGSEITRE